MPYNPVVIDAFPGLDLRSDPGDGRGAVSLSNVTVDNGGVRSRDGTTTFFTPGGTKVPMLVHNGASQLIVATIDPGASDASAVYAVNTSGTSLGNTGLVSPNSGGQASAVNIGTTAGTYTYVVDTGGLGAIKRWDGTTWSAPAGMPSVPQLLTYSPSDNRLVVIASTGSKVSFSDPGAPETFGANNYVQLTPGDFESFNGAVVFNNQIIVFKSSKFFVFYGTSDNPAAPGTPLFNYRTVDTGIGLRSRLAVTVGPDGVYFQASDGIYKTTGGAPVKVSTPLDPFFGGVPNPFWAYGTNAFLGSAKQHMTWHRGKLYVTTNNNSSVRGLFVYDTVFSTWTYWHSLAIRTLDSFNDELYLGNGLLVTRLDTTVSADAGAVAIVSAYRTPFESFGSASEKRLRETILEGVGSPVVQWSDDWGALGTGSTVTLGTSPAVATGRQRLTQRGREFSLQLGASSGAWSVNRVQVHVDTVSRPVSVAR